MNNENNIVVNLTFPTTEPEKNVNNDKHFDLWGLYKSLYQKRNDYRSNNNT